MDMPDVSTKPAVPAVDDDGLQSAGGDEYGLEEGGGSRREGGLAVGWFGELLVSPVLYE